LTLYRAALFIHEITHRSDRELPGFTAAWNVLVGIPLLMPSFLYRGVHLDHHRARTYGTVADPEYVPFAQRSTALLFVFVIGSLLAPMAFAIRFAIVAPLAWLFPSVRRVADERFSALVINHAYVRRSPIAFDGRLQEAGAFLFLWVAVALVVTRQLPPAAPVCWFVATAAAFGLNAFRTLAAHRYDHDAGELSTLEQLLDSCTIDSRDARLPGVLGRFVESVHATVAPVGLRYHALHHWIPSLPYHRLGPTHRLLLATLRRDAPYRATIERGFVPALRGLLRRSVAGVRA
jgi:fatty acid desaturase